MNAEYGSTRWWENYLVRYLMPSIAGVVIVSWLCSHGGEGLREALLLPPSVKAVPDSSVLHPRIDATSLTLLFLYGNIFCYIASYPILVFHVTRVIDFSSGKWSSKIFSDGYIAALVLVFASFCIFHLPSAACRFWLAYALAVSVVCIQLKRLHSAISLRIKNFPGLSQGTVSQAYAFSFALAKRRGISEIETVKSPSGTARETESIAEEDLIENERQLAWRQELIATYRHMREHGNSAFIFLLELALAALAYCVITKPGQSSAQQLGALGTLFAIWTIPSVFVHFLGQSLERRFSKFDEKLERIAPELSKAKKKHK